MYACRAKTLSGGLCQLAGNPKMAAAICKVGPAQDTLPHTDSSH